MPTIFPLSASVGQEYDGYIFDGTAWNLKGNEYNPTYYSATPPDNPKPGDLWVDSSIDIPESPLNDYLTISSASLTYATKEELENIDLSSASAAAVAAIVDSAPETLNTLNELAAALNDDANYASTVAGQISNLNSGLSQVITNKIDSEEAYSTFLTSASMQTVPVYVMNSGGSAQRPVSASVGMFRYNTDSGYPEWYDQSTNSWYSFYQTKSVNVEYLIVAGGGSGGHRHAGGGGAGGLLTGTIDVARSSSYNVTIGAGGFTAWANADSVGNVGNNSSALGLTATGGGGGGCNGVTGTTGGSGGGDGERVNRLVGPSGIAGQGYAGGGANNSNYGGGGGGGGASAAGSAGSNPVGVAGNGGNGLANSITGVSLYYAGGGGGGGYTSAVSTRASGGLGGGAAGGPLDASKAPDGSPNTGGGGGGGMTSGVATNGQGGSGGSGIVIISYPNTSPELTITSGLVYTQTAKSGYRVYNFTGGTGTVTFN